MKRFTLVIVAMSFAGCATIVKSERQTIHFVGGAESGETKIRTPDGTHTIIDGSGAVVLSRSKADIPIDVTCNGVTQKGVIPTRYDVLMSGGGNLIFGGIIGWIIDATNDKAFDAKSPMNISNMCSPKERAIAADAQK